MADLGFIVHVVERVKELDEEVSGHVFTELAGRGDKAEKLSVFCVLHEDEEHVVWLTFLGFELSFANSHDLVNVRMFERVNDTDFILNIVDKFFLNLTRVAGLHDLDGILFSVFDSFYELDVGLGTRTKVLNNFEFLCKHIYDSFLNLLN